MTITTAKRQKYIETGTCGTRFLAMKEVEILSILETDFLMKAAREMAFGPHSSMSATLFVKMHGGPENSVTQERQLNLKCVKTDEEPTYSIVASGENSSSVITCLGFEDEPETTDFRLKWTLTASHTHVVTEVCNNE